MFSRVHFSRKLFWVLPSPFSHHTEARRRRRPPVARNAAQRLRSSCVRACSFCLLPPRFFPTFVFALLAPALVGRWKERHRATYTFNGRGAELEMPPPFSACAQRVAGGAWLLPPEGDSEAWLAAVPAPVPTEDA